MNLPYHYDPTPALSPIKKRSCTNWNDCSGSPHEVCLGGFCECVMGFNMNSSACRAEICYDSTSCFSIWPNSRCTSNHQCVCEDDFEVDQATQTCRYHFMNTMKEPYFYGPFVCFVAALILLLAVWYFCCRRRRQERGNGTTIIFHKGEFPLFRVSNTVATDHIPTISQSVASAGGESGGVQSVASYTPFNGGDTIIIDNAVYRRTHSVANHLSAAMVCAHCALRHQEDHRCFTVAEQYSGSNGTNGQSFYDPGNHHHPSVNAGAGAVHLVHREHSYPLMSMAYQSPPSPPPPPPPPPPYTPLSDKLPIIS